MRDENIKALEKKFDSKIVVRGSSVNLDGKKDDLETIQIIMNDMLSTINHKGFVDVDDVNSLINLAKSGKGGTVSENGDGLPIILYTHKTQRVAMMARL